MLHFTTFFVVLFLCHQNIFSCPSSPSEEAATKPPETQKTSKTIEPTEALPQPSEKPLPSKSPKPPETAEPPKTTLPSETQKPPDTPPGTTQPPKTSTTFGTEKPVLPLVKKYIMVTTGITDIEPGNYVHRRLLTLRPPVS